MSHPLRSLKEVDVPSLLLYSSHPLLPQFLSVSALCWSYRFWAEQFKEERQRAWVITTVAAFFTTIMALPYLNDYLHACGSILDVQLRTEYTKLMGKLFQGYLIADLTVGAIHYPSQISWATGWGHHIAYVGIVEVAMRNSLGHLFCLGCIMELPTFLLGISTLYPRLRSNVLFASTFFLTRIMFHITMLLSCYRYSTTFTLTPVWILLAVFPLHVMWFANCLQGFVRRRRQVKAAKISPAHTHPVTVQLNDVQHGRRTESNISRSIHEPKPVSAPVRRRTPLYVLQTTDTESLRVLTARARQPAYDLLGMGNESLDLQNEHRPPLSPSGTEDARVPGRAGVVF